MGSLVYLKSFCPVNAQFLFCIYSIHFHDWEVKAAKLKCYHLKLSKTTGCIRRLATLVILWWAWRTDSPRPPEALGSRYSLARTDLSVSDVQHQVFLRGWVLWNSALEGAIGPKSHNAKKISSPGIMYILKKKKSKIAIHTCRLHWKLWSLATVHKTFTDVHLQFKNKMFFFKKKKKE